MTERSPLAPLRLVEADTQTLTRNVYDRLRADLLSARLTPGRKLQIRFLMDRYEAGQTPIREALNRLISDGLVECHDQRGFAVASISADELIELTRTRCWVEEIALRHAMAAATQAWEEELLLACHRLTRTKRSLSEAYEEHLEWERLHRVFHRALLAPCGSQSLLAFCDQLADRLYRYRQLSVHKIFPNRNVNEEHQAILNAVLEGAADRAVTLLSSHYKKTADIILEDLIAGSGTPV